MTCTAKLLRLLCFFFFCGKGCISTNYSRGKSEDSTNTACQVPYHPVGDYCLLIDNDIRGTWREMEEVCQALGGNLANLQDANILYEINKYIISNGMNNISYWVGATDEAEEGEWTWSSDNTTVKRGAPLWGHLFGQQPDGGEDQNCGVLHVNNFYYMHDDVCSQNTYGVICQPSKSSLISASGDLRPKGDADINTKFNESNIDCPYSYEIVGNACLQVFPELSYTWTEAKDLCNDPYTHLAKIDDANQLGAIYDYLTQKRSTSTGTQKLDNRLAEIRQINGVTRSALLWHRVYAACHSHSYVLPSYADRKQDFRRPPVRALQYTDFNAIVIEGWVTNPRYDHI